MDNKRRFLRLEAKDFLEMSPLKELDRQIKGRSFNVTPMGICFSSNICWEKGQVLLIDYFIPEELDSVKLKVAIVWSEFVDENNGYLTGGEIIDIDKEKETCFINYYFQKLKEYFFNR